MTIDHLAIAVRDVDVAATRLCALFGYSRYTGTVTNTRQDVKVTFLRKDGSLPLKLIEPANSASSLWEFVRKGGGLHHICFKTRDVREACAVLTAEGARVVTAPQPGEAFDDELIAFLYVGSGLNVEVIDTDRRRSILAPGTE